MFGKVESSFKERVEILVAQIPKGRVMTYGQIAALCGKANAAQIVGGIAHFGNHSLPWQRVVNRYGGLASGYPGGRQGHKQVIGAEGIKVSKDYAIDINKYIWWPDDITNNSELISEIHKEPLLADRAIFGRPLLVIVGETASGKSALAIQLAEKFGGEIIAADSRTIYKGMDIGTAKPSVADQMRIPHHLIDITTPDRQITVADYKQQADQVISAISDRGKLPILVGGTGLYIDSVIFNFQFRPIGDPKLRKRLSVMSVQALQNRLIEEGMPLPNNSLNRRHLIRSIESGGITALSQPLRSNTLIVGLTIDRSILIERIIARVEKMFDEGLETEVLSLVDTYGWVTPLQTIGYQEFQPYFAGQQNLDETKAKIIHNTVAYAKRQRTWFKRNNSIRWVTQQIEAVDIVTTVLNKKQL